MTDPLIGRLVGERFHISSRIGEGGMGIVYLAEDKAGGGRAALKFLHRHLMRNEDFVARFRQEGRSASRFRHESAVRILTSGDGEDGVPWLAMEYVPGRSLKSLLKEEGPLPVPRACGLAIRILRAVAEAHKNGIIHRDLKPENIKVETGTDGVDHLKVLDFGVAKFIGTEDMQEMTGAVKTKTGIVFGTPKYMAPEQILGEPVDGRSDVYSVGAMLYEMLTGSPPFASDDIMGFVAKHLKEPVEPPSQRAPDLALPPDLERIVLSMLEKNRGARPARAAEIADSLEPFAKASKRGGTAAAAPGAPNRAGAALYLAGAAVGAAGVWILARTYATTGIAASLGLGVGAAAAFALLPGVGERFFWLRTLVVAAALALGSVAAALASGAGAVLPVAVSTAALLSFVLYSAGWGRRSRLAALLLGGVVAPAVAVALLPYPGAPGEGEMVFTTAWGLLRAGEGTWRPALVVGIVALSFSLAGLAAPAARPATSSGGRGSRGNR